MESVQLGTCDKVGQDFEPAAGDAGSVAKKPPTPDAWTNNGGGDTIQSCSTDGQVPLTENVTRGSGDAFFAGAPCSPITPRKMLPVVIDDQEFVPDELKVSSELENRFIVGDLGRRRGYVFRNEADVEAAAVASLKDGPKKSEGLGGTG